MVPFGILIFVFVSICEYKSYTKNFNNKIIEIVSLVKDEYKDIKEDELMNIVLSNKTNNELSGTAGKGLRLEAIEIELTDEISKYYDIYYRVHAQNYGWLGWAKNGSPAGTSGYGLRLEGLQIILVKKGAASPTPTSNAYVKK